MNRIVVIGVNPPCPRCALLGKVIDGKVKELGIEAEIKHLVYTDFEAREIAKSYGLEAGTAKDVARKINLEVDVQKINDVIGNKTSNPGDEFNAYNDCNWSPELDELLRPFELQAKEAGIMMTPVLIINGELKHQGSVPSMGMINQWLSGLSNPSSGKKLTFSLR